MKKKFFVCKFDKLKANEALLKRSQIIGFPFVEPKTQKLTFCVSNLEIPKNMKMSWDAEKQELVIRFKINQDEVLSLGDVSGDPVKYFLNGETLGK